MFKKGRDQPFARIDLPTGPATFIAACRIAPTARSGVVIGEGWLFRPAYDPQAVDSTVSTPPLPHNAIWYCSYLLGREIARHPPAP
jgi:hypothetical protein